MSTSTTTPEVSPELELERLRTARAASEAELAALQLENAKVAERNRDLVGAQSFREVLSSTGVKFHPSPAEVRKLIETDGVVLSYSDGGRSVIAEKDGKQIDLKACLTDYAIMHRDLVDGRTLRGIVEDPKQNAVLSKSDLTNTAEKIAYINAKGIAMYEQLPLKRTNPANTNPATMTASEYLHLSLQDRMAFQQRADVSETTLAAILRRKA